MSLGTSKLYKLLLSIITITILSSCSSKNNVEEKIIKKEEKKTTEIHTLVIKKKVPKENVITIKEVIPKKKKIILKTDVKKTNTKLEEKTIKKESISKNYVENNTTTNIKVIDKNSSQKIKNKPIKEKEIIKEQTSDIRKSAELKKHNLDEFKFDFIKKGIQDDNTFLIVGGIQGDEPGGFMAASLFSTHYKITKGSVWVVPNLNFYSIIKRSRGPYGDMNRKFAKLSKKDPEYKIVQRIKKYIRAPEVSLILNLHDGSGFYRPMYIDKNHQPRKWGQSSVIDQEVLSGVKRYSDTYNISEEVVNHLNNHLLKKEDIYRTKNTHTRFKKTYEESEMAKTLTYYAVMNGKSAFGHETSKSLTVAQRVYYKLLAMEKYMDIMGIKFERKFKLNIKGIKKALNDDISIRFNDTDIKMPLKDIRNIQKYFPINKDGIIKYFPSNPLIKIIKIKNEYIVYYGNRRLTKLQADYAEHLNFNTKVNFIIDGKQKIVKFGDTVKIKSDFIVKSTKKYRVNVIGFKSKKGPETDIKISKNKFIKRYSIEKNGNIYRVEFYKGKKFAGMILVKYNK